MTIQKRCEKRNTKIQTYTHKSAIQAVFYLGCVWFFFVAFALVGRMDCHPPSVGLQQDFDVTNYTKTWCLMWRTRNCSVRRNQTTRNVFRETTTRLHTKTLYRHSRYNFSVVI